MEFLFERLTRQLASKRSGRAKRSVLTREEKFHIYKQPYIFCLSYKQNSPLLTRKVYFSMTENKRSGNPRIKIVKCVGAVKTKTCVEALQKQTMGLIFKIKILSYELVLTDRRNLSGTRPKSACGISSGCRFSFSAARNPITKATQYVTFGFSFRILVFFLFQESLNVTVCKRHGFFILLAAIIENKNDLGLRVVKALPFIHQPDREARKASDVSTADWRYQTLVKKHRIFSRLLLQLFSGLEILVLHRSLHDK